MEEIAHLIIRVSADQADAAKSKLKSLGYTAKETETATGGLMSKWKAMTGLLAGTVGIGTAIAGLNKLLEVAKRFESLEAQLKTATGSAENATAAFEAIQDFATQTPYDLAQATEAFIKLVNLGLTPSERALRSYGDTASAMGKDLSQMVQAVANATTGEFEMLKQFGIKARSEADGISLSFRGVTTKVKNDARSIEEYFISLGEINFAGAMSERMATLEGKISNLGDAWDVMFATISKAGAGQLMKDAIDVAISAVTEFTDMLASGQLEGYVDAILFKFDSLADGVHNAISNITDVLEMSFEYWSTDGKGAVDFILNAFKNMPENVRMYMRAVGATIGTVVNYAQAAWSGAYDVVLAYFDALVQTSINVGKEIWSHLSPTADDFDFVAAQKAVVTDFGTAAVEAYRKTAQGISFATDAWQDEIVASLDARDADVATADQMIKSANDRRAAYEKLREARAKAGEGTDRLGKFATGGKSATQEFEKLRESLRSQSAVIIQEYEKRDALILENTEKGSQAQFELLLQSAEKYEEARRELLDKIGADVDVRATALEDQNAVELAIMNNGYAEKQAALESALEARLITEEEYHRRSQQLETRHSIAVKNLAVEQSKQIRTTQLSAYSEVLGMASDISGQLDRLLEMSGKKSKELFIASKMLAIAQAVVYTELAAVRALAEGGAIAGIPLSTAIRALGYTSVALMAATSVAEYNQKFEHGGMIPAGKTGITQEAGFELVKGPAVVTSARATADMMGGAQPGGANVSVVVNNYTDAEASVSEREGPDGKVIELVIKRVKNELAAGVRNGGDVFSRAIEGAYGMRRGVA